MMSENFYLTMALDVVENINDDWDIAAVAFENEENAGEFCCTYQVSGGAEKDFSVSFESFKAFKSLHELMSIGGAEWNKAIFTLKGTGSYSIDFEYE